MIPFILTHTAEDVCTLTLNRPEKRNAINRALLRQLEEALCAVESDPAVRVVVLRGVDSRAFSAGGDLGEFRNLYHDEVREWISLGHSVFNCLENLSKPTIAVLEGYTLGGGLELALSCDFRIAGTSAVLGCPELRHGWLPGWGGMARLRRLVGEARAKEIVMLSERLSAQEAMRLGLLTRLCDPGRLPGVLKQLTYCLTAIPPDIAAMAKTTLHNDDGRSAATGVWFDILATHAARHYGTLARS